jgi:hypothetical protein
VLLCCPQTEGSGQQPESTAVGQRNNTVTVLLLQRGDNQRLFAGSLLIPVAGLIEVVEDGIVSGNARKELASMVLELRAGYISQQLL